MMSRSKEAMPSKRARWAFATLLAGGAMATAITTAALGASAPGPSHARVLRVTRATRGPYTKPIEAFAARTGHKTQSTIVNAGDTSSSGIPAGAVLLANVHNRSFYIWEEARRDRIAEHIGRVPPGSGHENLLCDGYVMSDGTSSVACGPAKKIAEVGEVGFGRLSGQSALTFTAVLPHGVKSVRFTDVSGKSYEVEVTDNVIVVEDNNLARPPATAVSYRLGDGRIETLSLPAEVVQALAGSRSGGLGGLSRGPARCSESCRRATAGVRRAVGAGSRCCVCADSWVGRADRGA